MNKYVLTEYLNSSKMHLSKLRRKGSKEIKNKTYKSTLSEM